MNVNYIFGKGVCNVLPLDKLEFSFSKRTGRLKSILLNDKPLATLRSNGSLAITVYGASLFIKHPLFLENCVIVEKGPDKFVAEGQSLFCKHVVNCGNRIKASSDVAIINKKNQVIGVGKAILSAKMMKAFDRGVAVKVRECINRRTEDIK